MKQLLWGSALAVLVAACGGGSKPPPTEPQPQPKSACAVEAENFATVLIQPKVNNVTEKQRPAIIRVITERCEGDAWSEATVACMTTVTPESYCDTLTDEQLDAFEDQMDREVMPEKADRATDAPGGSDAKPPPAPPPDDPCGGGA